MLIKSSPTWICPYSGLAEYLQGHPSTFQCYTVFLGKRQLSSVSFLRLMYELFYPNMIEIAGGGKGKLYFQVLTYESENHLHSTYF